MAVSYLEYLETSATADPGPDDLIRLADALGTTAAALHGGGLGLLLGQRRAAGRPVLAELTPAGGRELLAPGGVGRFLFVTDLGPIAVPVNYGMLGSDIVFRTSESGRVAAAARPGSPVSLSVDRIDDALAEGWSVLASGAAAVIPDPPGGPVRFRAGPRRRRRGPGSGHRAGHRPGPRRAGHRAEPVRRRRRGHCRAAGSLLATWLTRSAPQVAARTVSPARSGPWAEPSMMKPSWARMW